MKPLCTHLLLIFTTLQLHVTVTLAQNKPNEEREERFEAETDDRVGNVLKEYSFMADYSSRPKLFPAIDPSARPVSPDFSGAKPATVFTSVQFFGPANCGSRTRAILPDLVDSNLLFAGSTTGGLWKSTDAGIQWTPVDDQSAGMNITCITQNPFNPNIIYYGTGENKVRKIRDLGSGIYKSTDHGITFNNIIATNNDTFLLINSIKHSLSDTNTIYVATTLNGLFRSIDGGSSFQHVFYNGNNVTDIECFTDGKVMVTSSYDGIYYSASGDSGTFVKSTGTPTADFSRIEIAYCDSFPLIMYATFADSIQSFTSGLKGAYKSTDGGVSWFPIVNPSATGLYCYADFIMCLAVKPDDPDVVITGGARTYYTLDGGQTYTEAIYPRFDHHIYVFNKFNSNIFYSGQDQGIYRFDLSQIPPVTTDLMANYNTAQIWGGSYAPTGTDFFFGAQDNVFQKNSNQDSIFVRIGGYGSDGKNTHINQQNPTIGYACGDFADIYKSVNMSAATPVFTSILNELDGDGDGLPDDDVWHENQVEMNYLDGDQLYIPTRDFVWRSINGGANWIKITNSYAGGGTSPHPYAIGLSNEVYPVVYTGGTRGLFVRMDDAYNAVQGQETDLTSFTPNQLVAKGKITCLTVHPNDKGIVYATILHTDTVAKIWKITGADTNTPVWNDISGNFSKKINTYWIETDPDHPDSVLFVGTDYGLYTTTDGGMTWSRELSVPPVTIYQIRMRKSDRKLFVYTFGRGIWICDLLGTGSGITAMPADGLINFYPNPSHGVFNMHMLNRNVALNELKVSDMQGRILLEKHNLSGETITSTTIDLSAFKSGIYTVQMLMDGTPVIAKLVKY